MKNDIKSGASNVKITVDHDVIKKWVDERKGFPARVKGVDDFTTRSPLQIDFGNSEKSLERLSWDEFFKEFDEKKLEFVYQNTASDASSHFCSIVPRGEGSEDDLADDDAAIGKDMDPDEMDEDEEDVLDEEVAREKDDTAGDVEENDDEDDEDE